MFSMRDRRRGWKRRRVWGWLGPAVAFMALLPIGAFISYLDQWEDRLLADGPVVAGVVVSEPLPIIDRGQPLTVAFDTSRGQRVEMTIEKYLVPRRKRRRPSRSSTRMTGTRSLRVRLGGSRISGVDGSTCAWASPERSLVRDPNRESASHDKSAG